MSDESGRADWLDDVELRSYDVGSRRLPAPRWNTAVFVLGAAALAAGFYYEQFRNWQVPRVERMEPLDWLLALSLLAFVAFVLVPMARNPATTRRRLARLRTRRLGVSSLLLVAGFFLVGLFGPLFVTEPTEIVFLDRYQPPLFASIEGTHILQCAGETVGNRCQPTMDHPLGTDRNGRDMVPFVVLGARTALTISMVTAMLLVPVGIVVGLVAAFAGGRVDAALMRVAEVLQTVPAIVLYMLFWRWVAEYRLLMLVVSFGLVNWGGLARLVRNRTLELRERPFVRSARASGASRGEIVRWHLLPNLSRPVLANVMLQLPLLILTEAAVSFVAIPATGAPEATLGDPTVVSWGYRIYVGTKVGGLSPAWWVAGFPAAALILAVLSLNLFGRSLTDALDPQTEH